MRRFPQYNSDLQEFVSILFDLNEQDRKLQEFLLSIGYDLNDTGEYWSKIKGTPKEFERRQLFRQEQDLNRRWEEAISDLIALGYKGTQIPSRSELPNYCFWRDAFLKKAG